MLVGGYDPVTPPEFAEVMMLHLRNATLALDPFTAHALIIDDDPCVHNIIVRFLDAPETNTDVSCLVKTPPVSWNLP